MMPSVTPEQTAIITAGHLNGIPHHQIAAQTGLARETVTRHLHKPEIREKIEAAADRIVNGGLDDAVATITRLAREGKATTDKDWAKLGLDASKHITSMVGLSGNTPSTIINAMIQINQAPEQGKELQGITAFLANQWQAGQDEAIDVEQPIQILNDHSENESAVQKVNEGSGNKGTGSATAHTAACLPVYTGQPAGQDQGQIEDVIPKVAIE
jgi:hypothetical protein